MNKLLISAALAAAFAMPAFATSHKEAPTMGAAASAPMGGGMAAGDCASKAADKKLAGAAKTSFMTKCEKDNPSVCDTQAADKKLAGAAKTSFLKKCKADAMK